MYAGAARACLRVRVEFAERTTQRNQVGRAPRPACKVEAIRAAYRNVPNEVPDVLRTAVIRRSGIRRFTKRTHGAPLGETPPAAPAPCELRNELPRLSRCRGNLDSGDRVGAER